MTNYQRPASICSNDNHVGVPCTLHAKDMFSNMLLLDPPPLHTLIQKTPVFQSHRVTADFLSIPTKELRSDRAGKLAEFMGYSRALLGWWPGNKLDSLQLNSSSWNQSYTAVSTTQLHSATFGSSITESNWRTPPALLLPWAAAGEHTPLVHAQC